VAEPGKNASKLAELYRDTIRRHAAEPVGYRASIDATHRHEEYNPLCGDRIEIALRVHGDSIEAAAFDGEACAICMASASLLCELAPGRTPPEMQLLSRALRQSLGPRSEAGTDDDFPSPLQPLLGVRPYPSRVRCATLPWTAAVRALEQ